MAKNRKELPKLEEMDLKQKHEMASKETSIQSHEVLAATFSPAFLHTAYDMILAPVYWRNSDPKTRLPRNNRYIRDIVFGGVEVARKILRYLDDITIHENGYVTYNSEGHSVGMGPSHQYEGRLS